MEWIIYSMLGAAVAIASISLLLLRRRAWVDAGRSLETSLTGCRSLLALIGHFQQHRGMSSAWLSGDQSFGGKLESKAREIDDLFQALRPVARGESGKPHPCLTPNDLALFQRRWEELREKLAGLSVEQSIAQHSFLIDQLLQWLAALGEARLEPLVGNRCARGMVRNYASRLPALTECLGQARAVGMSVATRQACSAVARVRLMFLVARAEALLKQAAEGALRGAKAESATLAVHQMARLVRTRMLVSSGINVSVQEYFDVASLAVDAVFGLIAEHGRQLADDGLNGLPGRPAGYAPSF
ncbi:nitrate- and nitrite sensing domain-containing protein [Dechloromonas sp. A34]|uniref:nitrate- and nitrite sensing domain-containing protein n=1 Tax=Dechloromonas sp. A34 TaxID=447588 RepID=UPI00224993C2|nr:nitrate- and nitrite sensing domain-containing protein [Dechloromonas sp. A34]